MNTITLQQLQQENRAATAYIVFDNTVHSEDGFDFGYYQGSKIRLTDGKTTVNADLTYIPGKGYEIATRDTMVCREYSEEAVKERIEFKKAPILKEGDTLTILELRSGVQEPATFVDGTVGKVDVFSEIGARIY